jgi:hypothetical protein
MDEIHSLKCEIYSVQYIYIYNAKETCTDPTYEEGDSLFLNGGPRSRQHLLILVQVVPTVCEQPLSEVAS